MAKRYVNRRDPSTWCWYLVRDALKDKTLLETEDPRDVVSHFEDNFKVGHDEWSVWANRYDKGAPEYEFSWTHMTVGEIVKIAKAFDGERTS